MGTAIGQSTINVPQGYVLVPKFIRFHPSRILTVVDSNGVGVQEILLDFFSNNAGVPENTNISIRLSEDEQDYPLYFVLPVAGRLVIQMRCDVTEFADNPFTVNYTLNGNLNLSDGGPTPLQVGTKHREATDRGGNVVFANKGVQP